jgi:hypothetical protein
MRRARARGRWRVLLAAAGGAAAAWLLSPQEGARRRALVRDSVRSRAHRARLLGGRLGRDLRNRALGAGARLRGALAADEAVPDAKLVQRVRSRLGRETTHPHALAVEASGGNVVLRGPILSNEADRVLRAARSVRGVAQVEDRLERHCAADSVPALQGEGRPREH